MPPAAPAPIARAAADWVVRRDHGFGATEEKKLAAWCAADRRHAAEFARLGGAWRTLDQLAAVEGMTALADDVFARARARRARRRTRGFAFGAAAAAAVALMFFSGRPGTSPASRVPLAAVPTAVQVLDSTARRLTLPDGSVATLNGDSQIETDFTPGERRVRLVRGEAHFTVAKNPARPFLVAVGAVTVRAVGTAFNVRLGGDAVEVLVTEGKIRIDRPAAAATPGPIAPELETLAPSLVAGQRAIIAVAADVSAPIAIGALAPAEIDAALGWQDTRLVFNNTPLDEVVAAFNRHNAHQLALADPALRQRTLTGVIRADNLEGFLRLLEAGVGVRAETHSSGLTRLMAIR